MKNNVNKFKYTILKLYMSMKGLYRTLFVFEKGKKYVGGAYNTTSIYTWKTSFYEFRSVTEPSTGVEVFDYKLKRYPYWQIGLYNWKEIMKEEKIVEYERGIFGIRGRDRKKY